MSAVLFVSAWTDPEDRPEFSGRIIVIDKFADICNRDNVIWAADAVDASEPVEIYIDSDVEKDHIIEYWIDVFKERVQSRRKNVITKHSVI